VDKPEVVTREDRTVMIGVLANLSAAFLGADEDHSADANSMGQMVGRYRSDVARQLGHAPSDQECWAALEAQVARLRASIGEEPG
jgi:hypothetical protein